MDALSCKVKYMKLTPSITENIELIVLGILFIVAIQFNYDLLKFMMTGKLPW